MKCRTCHTSMTVIRQESGHHAISEWHDCPLCGQLRMTSQPMNSRQRLLDSTGLDGDEDESAAEASTHHHYLL